jgi:hypothetical protein
MSQESEKEYVLTPSWGTGAGERSDSTSLETEKSAPRHSSQQDLSRKHCGVLTNGRRSEPRIKYGAGGIVKGKFVEEYSV